MSIKRLQNFLMYDEVSTRKGKSMIYKKTQSGTQENNKINKNAESEESDGSIIINNATAKWLVNKNVDTLKDINLDIKSGELIAVVGQVGSGKTSLLNAILKELPLESGNIKVRKSNYHTCIGKFQRYQISNYEIEICR